MWSKCDGALYTHIGNKRFRRAIDEISEARRVYGKCPVAVEECFGAFEGSVRESQRHVRRADGKR